MVRVLVAWLSTEPASGISLLSVTLSTCCATKVIDQSEDWQRISLNLNSAEFQWIEDQSFKQMYFIGAYGCLNLMTGKA